jgi:hypothetical protein
MHPVFLLVNIGWFSAAQEWLQFLPAASLNAPRSGGWLLIEMLRFKPMIDFLAANDEVRNKFDVRATTSNVRFFFFGFFF